MNDGSMGRRLGARVCSNDRGLRENGGAEKSVVLCACTKERSGRDLERQGLLLTENLSLGTKMLAHRVWRPFLLWASVLGKDART